MADPRSAEPTAPPTLAALTGREMSSDELIADGVVEQLLHRLRERLGLDVVFVSEFVDGKRMFRFVDRATGAPAIEAGDWGELEASFCQRVVDGRLPAFIADVAELGPEVDVPDVPIRVGTHLGVPVVLNDGRTFGTLCCFSTEPNPAVRPRDLSLLHECASVVARKLERATEHGLRELPPTWSAQRGAAYRSMVWKLRGAWMLDVDERRRFLDS